MQSYGLHGIWSRRDTADVPTKSAVVGMLGCAIGSRSCERLFELSNELKMGVRVDAQGVLLTDYQTVGGGYMAHLDARGKPKDHTEETFRQYLADAVFVVALMAGEDTIARLSYAVQNPVWPYSLGRKSYPPARPLFDGVGDFVSLQDALTRHPVRSAASGGRFQVYIECEPLAGNLRMGDSITEVPRRFEDRFLSVQTIEVER